MKYLDWVRWKIHFEQPAQSATLLDYLHEVEHAAARITRLEQAIDAAVVAVPPGMHAVIEALQSLRGIAQISAIKLVAELGQFLRFSHPREPDCATKWDPARMVEMTGARRLTGTAPRRARWAAATETT